MRSGLRSLVRGKRWFRKLGMVVMLLCFIGFLAFGQYANVQMAKAAYPEQAMMRWLLSEFTIWRGHALLGFDLSSRHLVNGGRRRGLVMRPAEIHFLVSGPFSTRDILTLNLVRLGYRSLFSALVLSAVAFAYMPNVLAGFVGIWMVLCVSLLVGMIASLAARSALPAVVRKGRLLLSVLALSMLVIIRHSSSANHR